MVCTGAGNEIGNELFDYLYELLNRRASIIRLVSTDSIEKILSHTENSFLQNPQLFPQCIDRRYSVKPRSHWRVWCRLRKRKNEDFVAVEEDVRCLLAVLEYSNGECGSHTFAFITCTCVPVSLKSKERKEKRRMRRNA